jgi:hypothetical protein
LLGAPSLALRASQLVQLRCAVYFVRGGRRGVRLKPREHARRCRARVVVRQLGVFSPSRNSAERFVPKILETLSSDVRQTDASESRSSTESYGAPFRNRRTNAERRVS